MYFSTNSINYKSFLWAGAFLGDWLAEQILSKAAYGFEAALIETFPSNLWRSKRLHGTHIWHCVCVVLN